MLKCKKKEHRQIRTAQNAAFSSMKQLINGHIVIGVSLKMTCSVFQANSHY